MDSRQLGQHIIQRYDTELETLRSKVLEMGGLVEQQLDEALRSFHEHDAELAARVVSNDYETNAMELEIDDRCASLLARRAPMAADLRLVIAVLKAIADLERMGDEAVRIARMAMRMAARGAQRQKSAELRHLGTHVQGMVRDALDAFARTDLEAAVRVVEEDRRVDREYDSLTRELITFMMEDPRSIPYALEVLFSARALERIGDRACNLCEYAIYAAKGQDVRHRSLEHVQSQALESD